MIKGAVSRWMARAARGGEEALRAQPHLGAAPKLTPEQLRMLPEFLSHGAKLNLAVKRLREKPPLIQSFFAGAGLDV